MCRSFPQAEPSFQRRRQEGMIGHISISVTDYSLQYEALHGNSTLYVFQELAIQ